MPPALSPPRRPDLFDIVILGSEFADWLPALDRNSPLWDAVPHVGSVTHIGDDAIGDWPAPDRRLVIPLRADPVTEYLPESVELRHCRERPLLADRVSLPESP